MADICKEAVFHLFQFLLLANSFLLFRFLQLHSTQSAQINISARQHTNQHQRIEDTRQQGIPERRRNRYQQLSFLVVPDFIIIGRTDVKDIGSLSQIIIRCYSTPAYGGQLYPIFIKSFQLVLIIGFRRIHKVQCRKRDGKEVLVILQINLLYIAYGLIHNNTPLIHIPRLNLRIKQTETRKNRLCRIRIIHDIVRLEHIKTVHPSKIDNSVIRLATAHIKIFSSLQSVSAIKGNDIEPIGAVSPLLHIYFTESVTCRHPHIVVIIFYDILYHMVEHALFLVQLIYSLTFKVHYIQAVIGAKPHQSSCIRKDASIIIIECSKQGSGSIAFAGIHTRSVWGS